MAKQNLADFIRQNELSLTFVPSEVKREGVGKDAKQFACTIHGKFGAFSLPYSQASGVKQDPTIERVLGCVLSDIMGLDGDTVFEDWAGDFGYDDERADLRRILGADAFEDIKDIDPDTYL